MAARNVVHARKLRCGLAAVAALLLLCTAAALGDDAVAGDSRDVRVISDADARRDLAGGAASGSGAGGALTDDDDWGADWGTRDPCAKDGAFASAMPTFLEHCGAMAMADTPCTKLCNRAFRVISRYPVCLQDVEYSDMDETPWMDQRAGLKPEEALNVVFMMAFSRCHTANMLPSGPTSPSSSSKCDSLFMVQFEADVATPFQLACQEASHNKCTESCSHYNSMLRRHPCFGSYFHNLRRQGTADSKEALVIIRKANYGCALTSNKLQMINDMCSEENLLQFQDLTWNAFIRACLASYGAAKNPWAAWGNKAARAHAGLTPPPAPKPGKRNLAQGGLKAVGTATASVPTAQNTAGRDQTCHDTCKRALTQVLADEYCLQRFEENSANNGDIGATSLLADVLAMCDLTRPPPPPKYASPSDFQGEPSLPRSAASSVPVSAVVTVAAALAAAALAQV